MVEEGEFSYLSDEFCSVGNLLIIMGGSLNWGVKFVRGFDIITRH